MLLEQGVGGGEGEEIPTNLLPLHLAPCDLYFLDSQRMYGYHNLVDRESWWVLDVLDAKNMSCLPGLPYPPPPKKKKVYNTYVNGSLNLAKKNILKVTLPRVTQ